MASPVQQSDPPFSESPPRDVSSPPAASSPQTREDPICSAVDYELRAVAEDFPNMMKFSSSPGMLDHCIIDSLMPSPRFMQKMTVDEHTAIPPSSIQFEDELLMQAGSTTLSGEQHHSKSVVSASKVPQSSIATDFVLTKASAVKETTLKEPLDNNKTKGAWSKPLQISSICPTSENHLPASCDEVPVLSINDYWPALNKQPVRKRPSPQVLAQLSRAKPMAAPTPVSPEIIKASQEYPWAAKMKGLCNLHRVTTPVYMDDGTPKVSIPSHVLLQGIENQNQYVVGQFSRCSAPPGGLIHAIVSKIWGRKCRIFVRKLGISSYLFHIPDEATRKWVLQRAVWHVDDCLMFLSPWSPSPTISLPEISTIPIWLTLKNIPSQLYSITGIDWIASGIGEPLLTIKPWLDPTLMGEAKILVEIKLNKPFPQRVALEDTSGSLTMVDVLYSWLPSKCGRCGHLGHKASYCLGIQSSSEHVEQVDHVTSAVPATNITLTQEVSTNISSETILVEAETSLITAAGCSSSVSPTVSAPAIDIISVTKSTTNALAPALEPLSAATTILPTLSSIENHAIIADTLITSSATNSVPLHAASTCTTINTSSVEMVPILPEITINASSVEMVHILPEDTTAAKVVQDAECKQGNPPSLLLSDLDSTPHSARELPIHTSEEDEEDSMQLEGNQFALLHQNDSYEDSSSQTSRGGRTIKPTQKVQEMNWTLVGRRKRGRGGRGGRG